MWKTKEFTKLPIWRRRAEYLSAEERSELTHKKCKTVVGAYKLAREDVLKASAQYWELFNDPILCADVAVGHIINVHFNLGVFTLAKYAGARNDIAGIVDKLLRYELSAQYLASGDTLKSRTSATLMPDGTFDLHSPDPDDKRFSTRPTARTGIPVVAVVIARLIVSGEDRGTKLFLVNISDGEQMCSGVECRALPGQSGLNPLTAFNHVRLPATALLSYPDMFQDSQRALFDGITAVTRGTLSLGAMSIARLRVVAYTAGTAILRARVSGAPTIPRGNTIALAPQILLVLTVIAQTFVFVPFGDEIRVLYNSLHGEAFRQHFMVTLFKDGVIRRVLEDVMQLVCGQTYGGKVLLDANQISTFCDDLKEILLADGANSIRFAMEVVLGRLDPPMTANPDGILARYQDCMIKDMRARLSNKQHHDPVTLLPSCQLLLEAIGHRMAYEAAVAANIDERLIDLFVASIMKLDPGWYADKGGMTRAEQARMEREAAEALLPQFPELLRKLGAEGYVMVSGPGTINGNAPEKERKDFRSRL